MVIKKFLIVFALIHFGRVSDAQTREIRRWIESPRVTNWGEWKATEMCPPFTWAIAVNLKIEPDQGSGDDSAINGIKLTCGTSDGRESIEITSGEQRWGYYRGKKYCNNGLAVGFQLRSEPDVGTGDDAAASDLIVVCRANTGAMTRMVAGGVHTFGDYTEEQICPDGTAICGLTTQIEPDQGKGDDSALNNVNFACCP